MQKTKIAPSILAANFAKMGEEVQRLEENGADLVHCDIMDGTFVNNISFGIKMIEDIRKITTLPLDCHLMIVNPEKYVERFQKAGADIITVHYEACKEKLKDVLLLIKSTGAKCGAVINPDTPAEAIMDVLPLCDMLLVMSVFPGFGGQKFMPEVLEKVRLIRREADRLSLDLDIEIDGGISEAHAALVKESGINVLVAGSAVFKAENMRAVIEGMRNA